MSLTLAPAWCSDPKRCSHHCHQSAFRIGASTRRCLLGLNPGSNGFNAEMNAETKGQTQKLNPHTSVNRPDHPQPPPGDPRQLTQIVASRKTTGVVKFIAHPDKAVSCLPWCDSNPSLTMRLKVSSLLLLKVRSSLWELTHLSLKCMSINSLFAFMCVFA